MDIVVPADHTVKLKENEKKDKYLNLARELKKTMEHKSDIYTSYNWCSWYSHIRIIKGTGELGNKSGDYPIIEIGQNAENTLVDLRRLAVTQTSVKDHQLTLTWKTPKE